MNLLDTANIEWIDYRGREGDRYPVAYSGAALSIRDDGHLDLLYRWEPNSYCHFHTHLCDTTSVVLSGELHVVDLNAESEGVTIRRAGHFAHKGPGDRHREHGGPEGALVLFHLYAPDGRVTEFLSEDGEFIKEITIDDVKAGLFAQQK